MGRGAVRESMRIPVAYRLPSRPNRKGSSKIKYLLPVCAEHGILPITPDERGSGGSGANNEGDSVKVSG
jgi:hypothetical protein